MQELIEWYQREHFVKTTFYIQLLNKFKELLEKEKEQIIAAHINGQSEFDMLQFRDINKTLSDKYFNEKYK